MQTLGILMRTSLILSVALVSLCVCFVSASFANIMGVRLSYSDDTPTTMTVTWNTPVTAPSEVRYGTSPGVFTQVQSGTVSVSIGVLGFVHEVTLTGLQPETIYYYVASSGAEGRSVQYSFTTRPVPDPSCGSSSFVFLGDSEPDPILGSGPWAQIVAQAASHQPSFILHGGDMVSDALDPAEWLEFLTTTESVAAKFPFMPSVGNHDAGPVQGDAAIYNQLFSLPRSAGSSGSGTEDYYYFTSGNAIFVVLSTETFTGGGIPFATQAAWLDAVLTDNPRKWKFVIYHKPTYTYSDIFGLTHPPNEVGQNESLVAVIDAHHVDVVFNGHNHWYERYAPSACATLGNPGSDQPCAVGGNFADGTVYLVSGGGGAITIGSLGCGLQPGRVSCSGIHHYLRASIEDEILTLETWAAFPEVNEVIDSFTITKSPDCVAPPVPVLSWRGIVLLWVCLFVGASLMLRRQRLKS
jgi:hypothetical protein